MTTKENGQQSKKATKETVSKVENVSKPNLTDQRVIDVNANKLQNDDQRIEAGAFGMQDLEYESISPEQQKKNTELVLNNPAMDSPNSQDTGVNQQFIDDAKARYGTSYDDYIDANYNIFGSDITMKPTDNKKEKQHVKKLAYENTIPKLNFKKTFEGKKDLLKRVSKLPPKYKVNEKLFEMSDGENVYKIRWEGNTKTGVPVILEHTNKKSEAAAYEKHMKLSRYNTRSSNVSTSKLNEHNIFKNMLNQSREINGEPIFRKK